MEWLENDENVADILFQKMRSFIGAESPISLDTPEVNKQAIKLSENMA